MYVHINYTCIYMDAHVFIKFIVFIIIFKFKVTLFDL